MDGSRARRIMLLVTADNVQQQIISSRNINNVNTSGNYMESEKSFRQCDIESPTIEINVNENNENNESLSVCEQEKLTQFGSQHIEGSDIGSTFDDSDADKDFVPEEVEMNESSDSEEDIEEEKDSSRKPKKIIPKPEEWKQNIKKRKVNSGEEYFTKEGNKKRKKMLQTACGEKCRLKCSENIDEERRVSIFNSFYSLGNKTRQRDFINSCLGVTEQRKYRNPKPDSKRGLNYSYWFEINNVRIRVCKLFFKSTLDISNTTISTVIFKKTEDGTIKPEYRGKHNNHRKLDNELMQGVISHINSFARIESHYCRADNKREFIDGGLTISSMYKLYIEKQEEEQKPIVKLSMYSHIFNTKFNIGFFKPKKDLCSFCDEYENANNTTKEQLKVKYDIHQNEKELSREEKANDAKIAKENKDTNVLFCFDLQAVMPLPCGNVSTFYYKSKLNVYNFTIYNIIEKEGFAFTWNEAEARRGANEIATCVYNFLTQNCIGKNVTFYSDNCAGQNKNRFVVAMYLNVVKNFDVPSITHKFLIVGHTQNEGDCMHSCIETAKKRALLSGPIYVPEQIDIIIRLAKKTGKPYTVNHLLCGDVLDWKAVANNYKNLNFNTNREKINWNNIKIIQVDKNDPDTIKYKESYADNNFKEVRIKKKDKDKEINLNKAYKDKPKMNFKKKESLLSLLPHIPNEYHIFYKNIKSYKKRHPEENVEEDSD